MIFIRLPWGGGALAALGLSCASTPPAVDAGEPVIAAPPPQVVCARDLGHDLDASVARVLALRVASWQGEVKRVQVCLGEGADPNLAWPGAARWPELTRLVLEAGASPHGAEGEPCPSCVAAGLEVDSCPLCDAARHGTPDVVAILVASGADPDASEGTSGIRPIHLAAQRHALEVLRALLEAGADVNARDAEGRTALMYAVTVLSEELVPVTRLLVDAGAATAVSDAEGRRALDHARETLGDDVGALEGLLTAK